jgi:DNA-directed RNA polymerase subunit omega
MARICSEKAAETLGNRYALVLVASQRVRELHKGHKPKLASKDGPRVTALREIEEGLVTLEYIKRIDTSKVM